MQHWQLVTTPVAFVLTLIFASAFDAIALGQVRDGAHSPKPVSEPANIATIEHFVPHVSTVPANAGDLVKLYVRERVRDTGDNGTPAALVLFIHGTSIPVVPGAALGFQHYDWMLALAKAGFDVFAMDHTGYGFSPRPMMDDPCNVAAINFTIMIPNPLERPCEPSYRFRLANAQSEWDEIDAVVNYLRDLRGVERVNLIGWSQGGWRAASYASRHPDKVERLVLLAPVYNPNESEEPPVLPAAGRPFSVQTRDIFFSRNWDPGIRCAGQVEEGMKDAVWNAVMEFEPLGRGWGPPAPGTGSSLPDGVIRVRTFDGWGWNRRLANAFTSVPTLVIRGEFDTVIATTDPLYNDLGTPEKVQVQVQCASHALPWETQARHVHNLSKDWLTNGTIAGTNHGKFFLDIDGTLWPIQQVP